MAKDYTLEKRKLVIGGVAIVIVIIYIMRLFVLQIMTDTYKKNADSNAFLNKIQYPSRGAIYDRNGKLLVFNQPAYDITFVPREVTELDTLDFLPYTEYYERAVAEANERCEEPLDESRLFQIYASGIYDAALSGRVWCVSGKAFQISGFLYSEAYYPAIYL